MLTNKEIDYMVDQFVEATDGLVSEGITSHKVGDGEYQLHMKPYHLGTAGGVNIFSVEELKRFKYDWLTIEEICDMIELNEFPLNLRTFFEDSTGTLLLRDTSMYLTEIPLPEHIWDVIEFDMGELKREGRI